MKKEYTAIMVKSGDWYAGTVKELSGVHSQGKTIEELKENLKEAIKLIVESHTKHFIGLSDCFIEEQIAVEI
ncbi:type II toxin-antitoxin system HicB family antitoxin [Bacteroidota bacterium]